MPKKEDKYALLLNEINISLKRQNSLRYIFLQGLTRGAGTAFGATVLVALVTSITILFTDSGDVSAFMRSVIGGLVE